LHILVGTFDGSSGGTHEEDEGISRRHPVDVALEPLVVCELAGVSAFRCNEEEFAVGWVFKTQREGRFRRQSAGPSGDGAISLI
jgi:hypothetical protein